MVRATEQTVLFGVLVFVGLLAARHFRRKLPSAQDAETVESEQKSEHVSQAKAGTRINEDRDAFGVQENKLIDALRELDQEHLFSHWPAAGIDDYKKRKLVEQLTHLDSNYNGGLAAYITNAKKLLQESQKGTNPFEGYAPEVPDGEKLDFGSQAFQEFEQHGVKAAGHAAFVLVAGGLGERLGYSGIKLALPVESASNKCFLQVYIESILALQHKACKEEKEAVMLELVIMTSDDTHFKTKALLDDNNYFGMLQKQLHLVKQEKVACLANNDAHLALEKDDPYMVQQKPHGHGDVHALLHSTGLVKRWQKNGVQWVCFFQDTNGLVFRALPAALGVSAKYSYDVNSLAVPRKAKEAIGGIARLRHKDGHCMTINVEYNQLDPLLRAVGDGQGDVNDESGWSPYPGNINQLILKVDSYARSLEETQGIIAEFVNPKYKDSSKTEFKSSTRLECMMQDYPKALPSTAAVGFTVINQVWSTYSPVKNNPADALAKVEAGGPSHSATTGELDVYQVNCRALQMLGADVAAPTKAVFNGLHVDLWPRITWSPLFAITFHDLKAKFPAPEKIHLASNATLFINHDNVVLKELSLDGALMVEGGKESVIIVDGLSVMHSQGWEWHALKDGDNAAEHENIRGFVVKRHETHEVIVSEAGQHQVPGEQKASSPEQKPYSEDTSRGGFNAAAAVSSDECDSQGEAESASFEGSASKYKQESRSGHEASDHREGSHSVTPSLDQRVHNSDSDLTKADRDLVADLVQGIMTKAAAESKNVAAETKEAEKLAADAAKGPTPKDDLALKKGSTATAGKGAEETPGHVVPAAEGDETTAETGKHSRTDTNGSGSPKKEAKKPKTESTAPASTDKGVGGTTSLSEAVQTSTAKPSSPKKGAPTAASKEIKPDSPTKAAPSSPKKTAPSSPKKQSTAEKAEKKI